jgi:autonomous glycyl radical cofactor GrcA
LNVYISGRNAVEKIDEPEGAALLQVQVHANPGGAHEQREAAIGCSAVVKILGSASLPALRTGSRASALLQVIAFAADPAGTTNPVGAYEQREAAIGCAAVVKVLGSKPLPALRTGSRDKPRSYIAFAADQAGTTNPVGAHEQREAAIGCAAVVKVLDSR